MRRLTVLFSMVLLTLSLLLSVAQAERNYCPIYYGAEVKCIKLEDGRTETVVTFNVDEEDRLVPPEKWVIRPEKEWFTELTAWGPPTEGVLTVGLPDEWCVLEGFYNPENYTAVPILN